jgi:hypothetical protein
MRLAVAERRCKNGHMAHFLIQLVIFGAVAIFVYRANRKRRAIGQTPQPLEELMRFVEAAQSERPQEALARLFEAEREAIAAPPEVVPRPTGVPVRQSQPAPAEATPPRTNAPRPSRRHLLGPDTRQSRAMMAMMRGPGVCTPRAATPVTKTTTDYR